MRRSESRKGTSTGSGSPAASGSTWGSFVSSWGTSIGGTSTLYQVSAGIPVLSLGGGVDRHRALALYRPPILTRRCYSRNLVAGHHGRERSTSWRRTPTGSAGSAAEFLA